MTIKDAYIHIQQGLQNIAAFVYKDIELQELDYNWNHVCNLFVEYYFLPEDDRKLIEFTELEQIQANVDDLRVLLLTNQTITPLVTFAQGKYIALPSNYLHLASDSTVVSKSCYDTTTKTTITKDVIAQNRLTKTEDLRNTLDNSLAESKPESPVSHLAGNNLYIYENNFTAKSVVIDYYKKPALIAYGVDGSTILEFPDITCRKIINLVILYLSKVTQQDQTKIQNLKDGIRGKI